MVDPAEETRPKRRVGRWLLAAAAVTLAFVGWETWSKYSRRTVCGEADSNVRMLADRAISRSLGGHEGGPRDLPPSVGPTPAAWPPCVDGQAQPVVADWSDPGWVALGFAPEDAVLFRYAFTADPDDPHLFRARAHGDLDCDGALSTFERVLRRDPETGALEPIATRVIDRDE